MIKHLLALLALTIVAAAANAATPPSFTIDDVRVAENGGSATLTIHKSAVAKSYSRIRVYTWADGTATSGVDYQPINVTVTFGNKDLVKTVSVPIIDDNLVEGDETFHVDIGAVRFAAIARGQATVTIVDNDVAPPPPPPPPVAQWILAPLTTGGYARCKNASGCRSDSAPCPQGLTPPAVCSYPDVIARFGDVWMYAWNGWSASTATDAGHAIGAFWPLGQYKVAGVGVEGPASDWEGVAPAPAP